MNYLPATTYNAPTRQGRGRPLKTISEYEECNFGLKSDSEGDDSDRTIIARPAGLDAKLAAARSRLSGEFSDTAPSPIDSSPCSIGSRNSMEESYQKNNGRSSYADSDVGTVFSEDSCPSLAGSNDTTFYTNSSRNSVSSDQSGRSNRNRYPSILIPRGSWQEENTIKEVTLGMSPAQKILLSPQALSALPQLVPALNAPPSFGDRSSVASSSPGVPAISSAPITPDLRDIVPVQGAVWGRPSTVEISPSTDIEIAIDEDTSLIVSPREPSLQSERGSSGYTTDWSDLVVRFPKIPGGTPIETTPVSPDLAELRGFRVEPVDQGVQLPTDAMKLLQNLTRSYSPVSSSRQSGTTRTHQEMKERSDAGEQPRSAIPQTPTLSDYSFSQLSIPSPGGFFSSLQASSRATWCMPGEARIPSVPSSAVAQNFYDLPFKRASQTVQTILEMPEMTDGPPTARQAEFDVPAEYRADVQEDDDLYGGSGQQASPQRSPEIRYEYEAAYDNELKQAAEANLGRTSDWLSQQTTYLSALRESNPVNDPADYIPQTPHPLNDLAQEEMDNSPARKAVRFLETAVKVSDTGAESKKTALETQAKESVFLEAFEHCRAQSGRQDAFLQAATRLESVNSERVALPLKHIHALLNTHNAETLQLHNRPKYRGPFSQNPRATGIFQRTPEQVLFAEAERKQSAMDHIQPAIWTIDAQSRVLHKGKLLACPTAVDRLASSSTKSRRVLDLAGAATGSWAWTAAQKYPHARFITVQSKAQAQSASQCPLATKTAKRPIKAQTLSNHKITTVRQLWKLPFEDNYFDIISTRTLHMFLRSRPVPEIPSINEWDLTLKECMRVLKPAGIFDYILLDSHIGNNSSDNARKHSRDNSLDGGASISPTAAYGQGFASPPPTATFAGTSASLLNPNSIKFGRDLKKRGYEVDGGCAKIADRLSKAGFVNIKRQWVGLPLGKTGTAHDNVDASYATFEAEMSNSKSSNTSVRSQTPLQRKTSISQANGRSRTPFPPAPRPISEVSSISRIIEQYSNVEAVQGPVGSTADVSDIAGLLGTLMWEEWLVRHRLEVLNSKNSQQGQLPEQVDATFEATNLLAGINDTLAAGYAKGACFRGVVGWARKPTKQVEKQQIAPAKPMSEVVRPISIDTSRRESSYASRAAKLAGSNSAFAGFPSDETPTTASTITPLAHQYYARSSRLQLQTPIEQVRRDLSIDTRGYNVGSHGSPQWTESAVERGEVGTIPMMIVD